MATDDAGEEPDRPLADDARGRILGRAGLVAGPLLAALTYVALPADAGGLDPAGRATAAIAVWMATWWLAEALPIYATALLPLVLFPLGGLGTMAETSAPYAHPLIFLFLGGFMLALAMERCGLHRRFALRTLRWVGDDPRHMIGGFMAVAALLSMWVSNTATAVMMLPVALSVLETTERHAPKEWTARDHRHFEVALMLGVAYGASIGGVATPIGTPPNLFLLSYLSSEWQIQISFVRWMGLGVPIVMVMLPLTWWLLVNTLFRVPAARLEGGRAIVVDEWRRIGPPSRSERLVLAVFVSVCLLWLGRPLLAGLEWDGARPFDGLTDAGIAMGGALVLFALPSGDGRRVLDWATATRVPWGVLILFGGGLTLAAAIGRHGVDDWIGAQGAALAGLPAFAVVLAIVAGMIFLTELTSNTASTAALVPILAALAPGLGLPPLALAVPAALAASFAFMLPVATPPNAVVFGSGRLALRDMARAGLLLNGVGVLVLVAFTFAVALPLLGE